jgi:hypothetical protein
MFISQQAIDAIGFAAMGAVVVAFGIYDRIKARKSGADFHEEQAMQTLQTIFNEIKRGVNWIETEIGKGITALPKLITLTSDAEKAACTALPQTLTVVQDAGQLASASVKDSGQFVADLTALGSAIAAAAASKASNVSQDLAVATAFEKLCSDFNAVNFSDLIAAWNNLVADAKALDSSVLADLQKLEADAK